MIPISGLGGLLSGGGSIEKVTGLSLSLKPKQAAGPKAAAGNSDMQTISQMGQLLGQLQQLQKRDPAKLQQLLTGFADQLDAAAKQPGAGTQAQALHQLANRFRQAAQTGDLSYLQPNQAASHSNHRALQAYGQIQSTAGGALSAGSLSASNPAVQQALSSIMQQVSSAVKG